MADDYREEERATVVFECLDLSESPQLTRLDITCLYRPFVVKPLQIIAPYIRYLRLGNLTSQYTLDYGYSLIEAELDTFHFWQRLCSYGKSEAYSLQVMMTPIRLEKFQNIGELTVGTNFLQMLSLPELSGVSLPILNISTLIIKRKLSPTLVPGLARLVQSSPRLMKIIVNKCFNGYLEMQKLNPNQCRRSEVVTFPTRPCDRFGAAGFVASLMEFLLEKSKTLGRFVVYIGGPRFNTLDEVRIKKGRRFENLSRRKTKFKF